MITFPQPDDDRSGPVVFRINGTFLSGALTLPRAASGVVAFARAGIAARHEARNHGIAEALSARGIGTLLLDLLSPDEEREEADGGARRFDVELLADRLATCTELLTEHSTARGLPIGYFGVGTAAAAAMVAAIEHPEPVHALVCQGGRSDLLAPETLARLEKPTLLLVGDGSARLLAVNRVAYRRMACVRSLHVVRGATHPFDDVSAARAVGRSADWFRTHLGRASDPSEDRASPTTHLSQFMATQP